MEPAMTRRYEDKLIVPAMFFAFWLAGFWFMLHVA
jgi:hypothetical protein